MSSSTPPSTWFFPATFLVLLGCDNVASSDAHGGGSAAATTTAAPASTAAVSSTPAASAPSPEAKAKQIFAARCAGCHGAGGKGDGVLAASLTPRPRDCSDATWQKTTTDDDLRAVIGGGGAAVHMSANMPPSPDLAIDPATMAAMIAVVRSFAAR